MLTISSSGLVSVELERSDREEVLQQMYTFTEEVKYYDYSPYRLVSIPLSKYRGYSYAGDLRVIKYLAFYYNFRIPPEVSH